MPACALSPRRMNSGADASAAGGFDRQSRTSPRGCAQRTQSSYVAAVGVEARVREVEPVAFVHVRGLGSARSARRLREQMRVDLAVAKRAACVAPGAAPAGFESAASPAGRDSATTVVSKGSESLGKSCSGLSANSTCAATSFSTDSTAAPLSKASVVVPDAASTGKGRRRAECSAIARPVQAVIRRPRRGAVRSARACTTACRPRQRSPAPYATAEMEQDLRARRRPRDPARRLRFPRRPHR